MDERIMQIERAMLELNQPSTFLNQLLKIPWFQERPWNMLYQLSKTEQSPVHHPEGNVWKHTMLVVNEAAKVRHRSSNPRVFMWAALLHDLGKPETTRMKKGKITAYNHDKVGAERAREFLTELSFEVEFIDAVAALVRWHMQVLYVNKNLSFGDINQMVREVDCNEITLLGWCDRMGRMNVNSKKEEEEINQFYQIISSLKATL